MEILQSSADFLNIALAICAIAVSFFLCWALFYFLAVFRKIYRLTKSANEAVGEAKKLITEFKEKFSSAAYLAGVVGKGMEKAWEMKTKRKKKK